MSENNKPVIIMINQYGAQAKYIGFARYPNWGQYLVSKGFDVYILCDANIHNSNLCILKNKESFQIVLEKGVKYVYIKTPKYSNNGLRRIINLVGFYFSAKRIIRFLPNASIVIAQTPNPLACVVALRYSKKKRISCICDVVDLWPESIVVYKKLSKANPVIKLLYRLEKWIYKNSDALIFSMAGGYQYICDQGWNNEIPKEKVFHINTGVDIKAFDELKTKKILGDELLYDKTKFKVVYSGSVRLVNGLQMLCDAGRIIQDRGCSSIAIMIHGAGDYVEELKEYCLREGIKNVRVYGRIEKEDIPSVLSNSDLCVLCYQHTPLLRYGGSMNKMFDYFASGNPVLTNAKMGYSIIEKYNCGKELGTNDPSVLAEEIIHYSSLNHDSLLEIGRNSRRAAEQYDVHVLGKELETIISCFMH